MPYTPTPIRTRPYHLLRQLSQNGHELTLATCYSGRTEEQSLAQWRARDVEVIAERLTRQRALWNSARAVVGSEPLQAAYCWHPQLMRRIREALDTHAFDVVHVEHLRGACFGIGVQEHLRGSRKPIPVVWDSVDCITHLFSQASESSRTWTSRQLTRFELARTRTYEAVLTRRFAKTLVVSGREKAAFEEILGEDDSRVVVIPNGVDLELFAPSEVEREPATILLTGKMGYHANVTAALFLLDEIVPRVRQRIPKVRVQIVGQNPPQALVRRADAETEITGEVPSIRPFLNRATVACAPICYGAGIQNKVLEAMACGTAVVATPQAIDAMDARPEQDVLVGANASELSAQLVRVLSDVSLRKQLGENGRRYVQENHQWARSASLLEQVYSGKIPKFRQGGGIKTHVHA